jgi:hypothetical protein
LDRVGPILVVSREQYADPAVRKFSGDKACCTGLKFFAAFRIGSVHFQRCPWSAEIKGLGICIAGPIKSWVCGVLSFTELQPKEAVVRAFAFAVGPVEARVVNSRTFLLIERCDRTQATDATLRGLHQAEFLGASSGARKQAL